MLKEEKKPKKQVRNAELSKGRILKAAQKEFAKRGLSGARVDTIAARAKINKRMLYHYYGSKEKLYIAVLEEAYFDMCSYEQALSLEEKDPEEALCAYVDHVWGYYEKNSDFLKLVNNENLLEAKFLKKSKKLDKTYTKHIDSIEKILVQGRSQSLFRKDSDATQVLFTIFALTFYYLNNAYTNSVLFNMDLLSKEVLEKEKERVKKILLSSLN